MILSENRDGEESEGGGRAVVVVGVKLDSRSKELLTWALVKIAQYGDRVIALHVFDPSADNPSLISLVKKFHSVLAAYEGFCNLKQVDLKLKVCRGSPVKKILAQEVKSCEATVLIIGSSEANNTIRSRISVAKYCAQKLEKKTWILCAEKGKIIFQREPSTSAVTEFNGDFVLESRSKRRKTGLGIPPLSSSCRNEGPSMALAPIKSQGMIESASGWDLLHRMFLRKRRTSEASTSSSCSSSKKSSIVRWLSKLNGQQSVSTIYPDRKLINKSCPSDHHFEEKNDIIPLNDTDSATFTSFSSVELKVLGKKFSSTCQSFTFQELLMATNSFAAENLIGKGGNSQVYRGCLKNGKELAVKFLKPSNDALEHFVSELEILSSLHHKNIIKIVGFCIDEDKLLLVYDLLSKGSLEDTLIDTRKSGKSFDWRERYKVALGVAEALNHIHYCTESIIHKDVKSSNILLSDDFEPQLADFGLATWDSRSSHPITSSEVTGTFGYLAPEYLMHGKLNKKIDVYAFGVVLLELLSGRKPIDNQNPKGEESLVMWAIHVIKKGNISLLLDPSLLHDYDQEQFENLVLASTLCIRNEPQSRPEINLILRLLQGVPEVIKWAENESSGSDTDPTNMNSFINLALLHLEDDSSSISSTEQSISVEAYFNGRWSRTSSFA